MKTKQLFVEVIIGTVLVANAASNVELNAGETYVVSEKSDSEMVTETPRNDGVDPVVAQDKPLRQAKDRPNILFIAIDDMNDWTGFLGGHPQTKTPNLDRLAEKGVNFVNAHCPAPGCSPSRNALLYGVEPFHSGLYPFYDGKGNSKELFTKYTSLPQFFKEHGYNTYGSGKIHHESKAEPKEWTDYCRPTHKLIYKPEAGYQIGESRKMAFCPTTNPLEEHPDYEVASYGIEVLNKKHDKPFFLGVGIVRPHLPFVCPQRFFDALPEQILPPPLKADDHSDIPWEGRAMSWLGDDLQFTKDKAWNRVRRAYLACISWTDFNVGRVLDALEKSPYAQNTIIVVWSDHVIAQLPKEEAPLVKQGYAKWSLVGADSPRGPAMKERWKQWQSKMNPPLPD